MPNDSSTGGYLTPQTTPQPAEGVTLQKFMQAVIQGITGLSGNVIRPRWQAVPAPRLDINTDWIAIGIQNTVGDTYGFMDHQPGNTLGLTNPPLVPGYDILQRHETFELLCSVYGPNADNNASIIREGFQVSQNREVLQLNEIGFTDVGPINPVPALVGDQWYYRVDVVVNFKRRIIRTYSILNIASMIGELVTDIPPLTRTLIANTGE